MRILEKLQTEQNKKLNEFQKHVSDDKSWFFCVHKGQSITSFPTCNLPEKFNINIYK
jgi:hypothetical protein